MKALTEKSALVYITICKLLNIGGTALNRPVSFYLRDFFIPYVFKGESYERKIDINQTGNS